ncbi:MAG: hypothetical protein B7Y80_11055 [Hyphomicrobium sp. 32-62-53]|nr:MAG: hypothetical protein B7Z29_10420 [Hyphomicrobium sp. 12-62-95]OYX99520.1 MAG: hypothetical protein B7Y80_11055 [Hyphomicrobium sp. 32-62-53]
MPFRRNILALCLLCATALGAAPARAAEPLHAPYFTRAFSPDFVASADDSLPGEKPRPVKVYFRVTDLAKLKVISGKIVAADPFVSTDQQPLALDVPPGEYPVRLAILEGSMGRGRVAFARVDITERPVVRWESAKPVDMQRDAENPDGTWGVTVDSGVAAYFDQDAGRATSEAVAADETFFDSWLERGQNAGYKDKGASGAFRLAADVGPGNVVAFDTGWGEGAYTVYAGYDADQKLAALLMDFDILDWSKVTDLPPDQRPKDPAPVTPTPPAKQAAPAP